MGLNEKDIIIIWSNKRPIEKRVVDVLAVNNYVILRRYEISWSDDLVELNYSRLFGRKVSTKEVDKKYGRGTLLLFIIEKNDEKNLLKLLSQERIKGLLALQGKDANRVVTLLLGKNIDDSLKDKAEIVDTIVLKQDLVGAKGWESLEQFFYVLNNTINYCILRNAEDITKDFNPAIHGDIDFLVEDRWLTQWIMDAERLYPEKFRVAHKIFVNTQEILVDIRYIGDNYYCRKWEEKMINASQEIVQDGITVHVIPPIDQYYALLYHAYLQKDNVASDYPGKLNVWAKKAGETYENDVVFLMRQLSIFMIRNNYRFVLPKHITMPIKWENLRYLNNYNWICFYENIEPARVLWRVPLFRKVVRKIKNIVGVK